MCVYVSVRVACVYGVSSVWMHIQCRHKRETMSRGATWCGRKGSIRIVKTKVFDKHRSFREQQRASGVLAS